MKILITGGAGFIGSAVVRFILEQTEDEVLNVDLLTYAGNLASLPGAEQNPGYQFSQTDICEQQALARLFDQFQPDAVMHLAAESHVDRSIDGPEAFIQTNVVGTYSLLQAAMKYWGALPAERAALFRFHHISTDEVYGDLKGSEALFTEQTSYKPRSP